MNSTASPAIDETIGLVAKTFRVLRQAGLTFDDLVSIVEEDGMACRAAEVMLDGPADLAALRHAKHDWYHSEYATGMSLRLSLQLAAIVSDRLTLLGWGRDTFQLLGDSPVLRRRFVQVFHPSVVDSLAVTLPHDAVQSLLRAVSKRHPKIDDPTPEETTYYQDRLHFRDLTEGVGEPDLEIIIRSFGLDGNAPKCNDDVALELHIKYGRVSSGRLRALDKMRLNYDTRRWEELPINERPIAWLGLSGVVRRRLGAARIRTIGDLLATDELKLLRITNFGPRDLVDVKAKLADRQLMLAATQQ